MGLMESIPPELQENITRLWTSPKKRAAAMAVLVMVAIIGLYASFGPVVSMLPVPDVEVDGYRSRDNAIRRDDWRTTSDYDIVVSHYNEDLNIMRESIQSIRSGLPSTRTKRVIIYAKGPQDKDGLKELLDMSDEVVQIPNVGREGETYLSHIVRHYDTSSTNIARHTLFMQVSRIFFAATCGPRSRKGMGSEGSAELNSPFGTSIQPHVAWDWVFLPRLEKVLDKDTGFLSFGPYISHTCGNDSHGQVHPRMSDIYSMFRMDLCPPEPVLPLSLTDSSSTSVVGLGLQGTWAGQFIVSRHRILENPKRAYANLRQKFHEPKNHWIFKEGWWNNEPSNPTLGELTEGLTRHFSFVTRTLHSSISYLVVKESSSVLFTGSGPDRC
uniref:Uncharacterized protein n=1 Tax=Kwoniella dejecticola CBS 10117 TaxID=1296121 RepID=A0A1A6A1V4_9TREE|nr:uncharacterized protein I303_06330 [Kwoniella dejecticola CBS 10117]OBR84043.1 hypothetical protein I303_06330 [Kwoniella dejecticola CBS 10117]